MGTFLTSFDIKGKMYLAGRVRTPCSPSPQPSLGERESHQQSVGESCSFGKIERRPWLLPLPLGEGWGEGEGPLDDEQWVKAPSGKIGEPGLAVGFHLELIA